jgi:hypothetical protein
MEMLTPKANTPGEQPMSTGTPAGQPMVVSEPAPQSEAAPNNENGEQLPF